MPDTPAGAAPLGGTRGDLLAAAAHARRRPARPGSSPWTAAGASSCCPPPTRRSPTRGRGRRARLLDHAGRREPTSRSTPTCRMPWPDFPPHSPAANPTGVYERDVDIPADVGGPPDRPAGRRRRERAARRRWTGGRSASARTPTSPREFDLTDAGPPRRRDTVRLTVVKWSDASHIEDQDQWWHGGITRSVLAVRDRSAAPGRRDVRAAPADGRAAGRRPGARTARRRAARRAGTSAASWTGRELRRRTRSSTALNAEDERVSDFLGEARLRHAPCPASAPGPPRRPSCTA